MAAIRYALETDRWVDDQVARLKAKGETSKTAGPGLHLAVCLRFDHWWWARFGAPRSEEEEALYTAARGKFFETLVNL